MRPRGLQQVCVCVCVRVLCVCVCACTWKPLPAKFCSSDQETESNRVKTIALRTCSSDDDDHHHHRKGRELNNSMVEEMSSNKSLIQTMIDNSARERCNDLAQNSIHLRT